MIVPDASPHTSNVFLGRLSKAFGIRGEMKFVASDDFWDAAMRSSRLVLQWLEDGAVRSKPARVERIRPHGGHFVVKLEGIDDRDAAEAEAGSELFVDVDDLDVELPEVELPFQVIGSRVRLEGGRELGTVASVMFSAAHPVYVVQGPEGELLIPVVDEFVVGRDEGSGEITIRPIPGLVE